MRTILSFACVLAALGVSACRGSESGPDDSLRVTASTTLLADFVANVIGERGEVDVILAASSDPHDYEPRPSDAQDLDAADLVVSSGGEVDDWLGPLIDSSGSGAPVVSLIESMPASDDPHWWQNPQNAEIAVSRIADELARVDPEGEDVFRANAKAYIGDLEALDKAVEACLRRVPEASRKLVTSHDAMGHYAERYGVEMIGAVIPAQTTQAQASAGEIDELIELIRSEGVNAVFSEAGVTTDLEQAVVDEADAEVGGQLWTDALGPEGSTGETYLEMVSANTETLVAGMTAGAQACGILGAPSSR